MKLLHIDSSILGETSVSRALSADIVKRLSALTPGLDVTYRDLAADPLPHVTLERLASAEAGQVLEEFLDADVVVIGAPMYNFGLSSQLKAWIDHVLIAGKTFRYGPQGVEGLAAGKRVFVAHARGGLYGPDSLGAASEHAESHLLSALGFVGVTDVKVVIAEGVALSPEHRNASLAEARERIEQLPPAAKAA